MKLGKRKMKSYRSVEISKENVMSAVTDWAHATRTIGLDETVIDIIPDPWASVASGRGALEIMMLEVIKE